jgi:hypothetical protein
VPKNLMSRPANGRLTSKRLGASQVALSCDPIVFFEGVPDLVLMSDTGSGSAPGVMATRARAIHHRQRTTRQEYYRGHGEWARHAPPPHYSFGTGTIFVASL